jgi:Zn-dependent protease
VTQISWTAGSMVVSVAAYAKQMGWAFAVGFIVVLVLHEVGHAVMIRAKGLRAGAMVFIPFIGGAVTLKRQPRSAYTDAQIALAGPIAGAAASFVSLSIYRLTGDALYLKIAHVGFLLNLFNLIPIGPLDGGRISAAITKWMWVLGGLILMGMTLYWPNPLLIILVIFSVFQIYRAIGEERRKRFYNVTVAQRGRIAAIYFTLLVFLAYESLLTFYQVANLLRTAG